MIDMFGEVGMGMGGVWDCWGEWGLEDTRDDKIPPYSVKYLLLLC